MTTFVQAICSLLASLATVFILFRIFANINLWVGQNKALRVLLSVFFVVAFHLGLAGLLFMAMHGGLSR